MVIIAIVPPKGTAKEVMAMTEAMLLPKLVLLARAACSPHHEYNEGPQFAVLFTPGVD